MFDHLSSTCAKVCTAHSYKNAQCSQELARIPWRHNALQALFGYIRNHDITVPSIASIALYSSLGERSVGD